MDLLQTKRSTELFKTPRVEEPKDRSQS